MLGWLRLHGLGMEQDEVRAAELFRQAAQLGSAVGAFYVARHLSKLGRYSAALPYYQRASDMGHLPSTFWVGYCAAKGQGADRDVNRAYQYLKVAALHGHVFAIRELALLDIRGCRGLGWRLLAPCELAIGLLGAVLLAMLVPESDRTRA